MTAGTSTTRTPRKTASRPNSRSSSEESEQLDIVGLAPTALHQAISAPENSDDGHGKESTGQTIIDNGNTPGGESDRKDGPSDERKSSKKGGNGMDESSADADDLVIAENVPGYNPVVKVTASGRGFGCSADSPVPDNFTFWIEEQSESQGPFPRALTNFRFVDLSGHDVSVALGQFGNKQPLRAIGIAASANQRWDSGQRIAAGWWNADEITRDRAPMEMLWTEFQVNWIKRETPAWFRNGKTKALVATSDTAEYILQSPDPDYAHRWSACVLPTAHLFKEIGTTTTRCPKFMDWEYYLELREDVARWEKDGKAAFPELTDVSDLEKERLAQEGHAANMRARKQEVEQQL